MSYNSNLQKHNVDLQSILNTINNLPEAGAELPELTNEGTTSDLLSGKQLIDSDGNIVTGTIPNNGAINGTFDGIDTISYKISEGYTTGGTVSLTDDIPNEVAVQSELLAQIKEVLVERVAPNTIYIGSSQPTNDIGENGDIYIVRSDS